MNKIRIYVSCHKKSKLPTSSTFCPIQVGSAVAKKRFENMLHDDIGDNISTKNPMYCELTAQYWAWKNDVSDYYGFCHYRRYFSFSDSKLAQDIHGAINCDFLDSETEKMLGMSDEEISKRVLPYDFLIGSFANLRKVGIKSLYDQYDAVPDLNVSDMRLAIKILKKQHPEYAKCADEYMNGYILYPCNMFIMKKKLFFEYCEWLFPILEETEKQINWEDYSIEGYRTIGHIAERLLGIFFLYIKEHSNCKISVIPRTIVWSTDPLIIPKPHFEENNIPIVFCCSDFFVPYVSATLQSLIEHCSNKYNYDICFLHTDISKDNQDNLITMAEEYDNISIRFINILSLVYSLKLVANNHVSVQTFYRLLTNNIFSNYKKVLYLDSDLIILRDVAELYYTDLQDNLLAATIDPDHAGEYNGAIPGVKKYTSEVLKLSNPYQYFQAGVILFNIEEFNKQFSEKELIEYAQKREFMYVDQDVLNILCEKKVTYIDMRWNVMTDCNHFRMNGIIRRAPRDIYNAYMKSREMPYIIHYAGNEKPWNSPLSDYAEYFWTYSRKTMYYEAVLWRMGDIICSARASQNNATTNFLSKCFWKIANWMFPKGTHRREFVKGIYYRIR